MKIFDDKKSTDEDNETFVGSFEDMIKTRKKELPKYEKTIQKVFKDYHGQPAVIVLLDEDENGQAIGYDVARVGTGLVAGQLKLGEALHTVSKEIGKEALTDLLENSDVATEILRKILKNKGDK